jgi:hypothetical protein
MASGMTLIMRNRRKPPPVQIHQSVDGTAYVNRARDLKPGRHLRPEIRALIEDLGPEAYLEAVA